MASDLGLHCLPMSHKRTICLNELKHRIINIKIKLKISTSLAK